MTSQVDPSCSNGYLKTSKIQTNTEETTSFSASSSSGLATNGHLANFANGTKYSDAVKTKVEEELKILSHLKTIDKINERRHQFLNNIVQESIVEAQTYSKSSTQTNGNEGLHKIVEEKETNIKEEEAKDVQEGSNLPSPVAPPKPPMLSRTKSKGSGDQRLTTPSADVPPTPPSTPVSAGPSSSSPLYNSNKPQQQQSSTESSGSQQNGILPTQKSSPITSTTVKTSTMPELTKVETVNIDNDEKPVVMRQKLVNGVSERSSAEPSTATENTGAKLSEKSISAKHYEHLIEELKCPGCATPMKAPILLCETGHSICEQCTRILLMCPLCKKAFTKFRSLTVEALCSKAHFRCVNASGGCGIRLQKDLLAWHEMQCVYKPMKCFMGRIWGDCDWDGREIQWKEHIEAEHQDKVYTTESMDLIWNMAGPQKPLRGYYVFQIYNEMFNFYEIYDKERILFTMTCTSSNKEKKNHYAYEVTISHPHNEALAITQKFPIHSEYDKDILSEGTCVAVTLSDLAKFIDEEKLLHYKVRVIPVNSPRKSRFLEPGSSNSPLQPDYQNTQLAGGNLKNVPSEHIVTRKITDDDDNSASPSSIAPPSSSDDEMERIRRYYNEKKHANADDDSDSDPELDAFIAKRWGTPQLHFNRKYLKNLPSESSSTGESISPLRSSDKRDLNFDKASVASSSYKKKVSNSLRKSFRALKTEFNEIKYFGRKSPEKLSPN